MKTVKKIGPVLIMTSLGYICDVTMHLLNTATLILFDFWIILEILRRFHVAYPKLISNDSKI